MVLYSRLLNANSRPDEEPTTEGENREVWPYRISSERRGNKEVPCSVAGRRWTRSSPRSLQPLPSAAALLSPASDSASCSGQDGATWRAAAGGVQRLAVKPPPPLENKARIKHLVAVTERKRRPTGTAAAVSGRKILLDNRLDEVLHRNGVSASLSTTQI